MVSGEGSVCRGESGIIHKPAAEMARAVGGVAQGNGGF